MTLLLAKNAMEMTDKELDQFRQHLGIKLSERHVFTSRESQIEEMKMKGFVLVPDLQERRRLRGCLTKRGLKYRTKKIGNEIRIYLTK